MGQQPLLPTASGGEQPDYASLVVDTLSLTLIKFIAMTQSTSALLLSRRSIQAIQGVNYASSPNTRPVHRGSTRPPIVTLFDQVGSVVSVDRVRGSTLWASLLLA